MNCANDFFGFFTVIAENQNGLYEKILHAAGHQISVIEIRFDPKKVKKLFFG